MATNDLISLRLSVHAEEPQQVGILKAWDRAVTASQIMKMSILVETTAGIVFAVLSVENPIVLANATASLVGTSAPQDGTQSMPKIQSTADAPALLPTASEAPTGDEIAAALKTADQSQTDTRQPSPEAPLNQFQARAAEDDARPQVRPVQPVQDAQAQVVQNAPEQARPVQKQRQVRPVQNAGAKVVKNARAQLQRARNRAQVRPEQNAQTQVRSVQNAQAR